jgi:hypothetical protein
VRDQEPTVIRRNSFDVIAVAPSGRQQGEVAAPARAAEALEIGDQRPASIERRPGDRPHCRQIPVTLQAALHFPVGRIQIAQEQSIGLSRRRSAQQRPDHPGAFGSMMEHSGPFAQRPDQTGCGIHHHLRRRRSTAARY